MQEVFSYNARMPEPESGTWTARLGATTLRNLRLLMGGLAILFITMGLMRFREGDRARGWITVGGRVVSSRVNEYTAKDGTRHFRPLVIYAYGADDNRFMSSRLSFRPVDSTNRADAEQAAGRYPVGTAVRVHYDPGDPQQAVLEPTNPAWTPIILAGVCAGLAITLRILSARLDKRGARARRR
jgi:hypothetical protein